MGLLKNVLDINKFLVNLKIITLALLYPSPFRAYSNSSLVFLGIHEFPPYIAVRGTFVSNSLIRLIRGRLDQKKYLPNLQKADSPLKAMKI